MSSWFNVDKAGLAALMKGRSKSFVLYELIQNAWDQNIGGVKVTIRPIPNTAAVEITVVDDDPEGFTDLAHAYTLFASSAKKTDPTKRGRFNLGEKLVLALARKAVISTTKGTVTFDETGRHRSRTCRPSGSHVQLELPMTRAEMAEMIDAARKLIPPAGIVTIINDEELMWRDRPLVIEFETILPTLVADDEGVMQKVNRKTTVGVYQPLAGEPALIYEMGIPVVETGDRFHVNVHQKVPLNTDRDNVTPGYLKALRVAVLNATADFLDNQDVTKTWVKEACGDSRVYVDTVKQVMALRFGEDAVAYDPSDPEANKLSAAAGRQVIYGGNLSGDEWEQVRRAGTLLPAGQVTPSPKPYSPDGEPLNLIPEAQWTAGMCRIVDHALILARELLDCQIEVLIAREASWPYSATYGPGRLVFNLSKCGHRFFDEGVTDRVNELLIHEFGHHYSRDHLSAEYHRALTDLGARMVRLALSKPELFR